MKISNNLVFVFVALFWMASPAKSQEAELLPDGGIAMQMGVDGVVIEHEPNGEWRRIYARYEQPVSIPDARGIKTAKTIAEEKAKAMIVRFQNESVATGKIVSEVDATIGVATSQSDGAVSQYFSQNTRQVLTSLEEMTQSYARGELRGVIKIGDGYDADTGQVWTEVGISRKTMSAAAAVSEAISDSGRNRSTSPAAESSHRQPATQHPKSHARKTTQEDW